MATSRVVFLCSLCLFTCCLSFPVNNPEVKDPSVPGAPKPTCSIPVNQDCVGIPSPFRKELCSLIQNYTIKYCLKTGLTVVPSPEIKTTIEEMCDRSEKQIKSPVNLNLGVYSNTSNVKNVLSDKTLCIKLCKGLNNLCISWENVENATQKLGKSSDGSSSLRITSSSDDKKKVEKTPSSSLGGMNNGISGQPKDDPMKTNPNIDSSKNKNPANSNSLNLGERKEVEKTPSSSLGGMNNGISGQPKDDLMKTNPNIDSSKNKNPASSNSLNLGERKEVEKTLSSSLGGMNNGISGQPKDNPMKTNPNIDSSKNKNPANSNSLNLGERKEVEKTPSSNLNVINNGISDLPKDGSINIRPNIDISKNIGLPNSDLSNLGDKKNVEKTPGTNLNGINNGISGLPKDGLINIRPNIDSSINIRPHIGSLNTAEYIEVQRPRNPKQEKTLLNSEFNETPSSAHFMGYFLTAIVLCIAGYVVFHNKQKIIAFIVEGRNQKRNRRPNSGEYKKLQTNVDDVMSSLEKTTTSKNYIY